MEQPPSPNTEQLWDTVNQSEPVRTIFVSGLPMDTKPRELYLLMRNFPGFVAATLKSYGKNGKTVAPVGFVSFQTRDQAVQALHQLKGLRMDPSNNLQIRVEFAHTNMRLTQDLSVLDKMSNYFQPSPVNCIYPNSLTTLPGPEDRTFPEASGLSVLYLPGTTPFPFTLTAPSSLPPPPTPLSLSASYNWPKSSILDSSSWPNQPPLIAQQQPYPISLESASMCIPLLSPDLSQIAVSNCIPGLSTPCSSGCGPDRQPLWSTASEGLFDQTNSPANTTAGTSGYRILSWPCIPSVGPWFIPRVPPPVPESNKLASAGHPLMMMTTPLNSPLQTQAEPFYDISGEFEAHEPPPLPPPPQAKTPQYLSEDVSQLQYLMKPAAYKQTTNRTSTSGILLDMAHDPKSPNPNPGNCNPRFACFPTVV